MESSEIKVIKMVKVISRNLKKCVSPRQNLPIIALNTWVTCPNGDLKSRPNKNKLDYW